MPGIAAEGDEMEPQTPAGPTPPTGPTPPGGPPPAGGPIVHWAPPPPPPPPPETPGAPGLAFAEIPPRLVAWIVDGVSLAMVGFTIAGLLGQGQFVSSPTYRSFYVSAVNPVVALIFGLTGALYFIWSWSGGRRATPGQRLFHLQVGNAFDGAPLSTSPAFRRWFAMG